MRRRSTRGFGTRRGPRARVGWRTGLGVLLVTLLAAIVLAPPSGAHGTRGLGVSSASATPSWCTAKFGSTPAALLIPEAGPTGSAASGSNLTVTVELRPTNYTSTNPATNVYLPSLFATFPLSGGGAKSVYLAPRVVVVNASSPWSAPALASRTVRLASGLTFATGANATLSTQKLAVMADTPYPTLFLEFRWSWALTTSSGTTAGAWSVPNATVTHPSIFPPAPYVSVSSRTPSPQDLGTLFHADLLGAISNQSFFIELEYASSGHVVRTHGARAPVGNATPFPATILLTSNDDDLAPATMLVHIHNSCGAMLWSLPVKAQFATSAAVTLATSSGACGRVVFNLTSYHRGHTVYPHPSTQLVPIRAPTCAGHPFSNWVTTGVLDVSSPTSASTSVLVTYNGTLEAKYA